MGQRVNGVLLLNYSTGCPYLQLQVFDRPEVFCIGCDQGKVVFGGSSSDYSIPGEKIPNFYH